MIEISVDVFMHLKVHKNDVNQALFSIHAVTLQALTISNAFFPLISMNTMLEQVFVEIHVFIFGFQLDVQKL